MVLVTVVTMEINKIDRKVHRHDRNSHCRKPQSQE